jgi:cell division protein FtsW (lipid II flippase)
VLYALLAVLAWPGGREERAGGSVADGSPLGRYAKLPWLLLWTGMACLMAMTADQAPLTVIAFTTAFAAVAAGVWNRGLIRPALIVAAVAAVVIWVTGEQFGALFFTGQATDPNTGPLLLLVIAAYWPLRGHNRLREPAQGSSRTFPAALAAAGRADLDDPAADPSEAASPARTSRRDAVSLPGSGRPNHAVAASRSAR